MYKVRRASHDKDRHLAGRISDHPATSAFPTFTFSDDIGNYSPIGRDKAGTTKSQTIQFADNLTWIKGRHTMKFKFCVCLGGTTSITISQN